MKRILCTHSIADICRMGGVALIIVGIAGCLCACSTTPPKTDEEKKVIIAYFSGGQIPDDMPVDLLTHICYAFANVHEDGSVRLESADDTKNLERLVALKEKNPQLKILLSIGGWGWSKYFSNAALTAESRKRFVSSAIELVARLRLDGLDIDWEYPGQPGDGNVFRPEDKENFTILLKDLRESLDALQGNPHHLLTVATGAFPLYLQKTEPEHFEKYVDYINVMTYDFCGFDAAVTGHHTNLRHSPSDANGDRSAMNAVEEHVASGIPARKLVLGCAFYGKGWEGGVDVGSGTGLFARVDKESSKAFGASYAQLVEDYVDKNGYTRHWDANSEAPYLWNAAKQTFITYDDEESITAKCKYARLKGLAGVMFWEYHGDKNNSLLKAIHRTLCPVATDQSNRRGEATVQ